MGSLADSPRPRCAGRAEKSAGPTAPYALQAAIAACHARAPSGEETDWARIVALYERLAQLNPSPIVELNRAVAVAMASGAEAGLKLVEELISEPSLGRIICCRACAEIFSSSWGDRTRLASNS